MISSSILAGLKAYSIITIPQAPVLILEASMDQQVHQTGEISLIASILKGKAQTDIEQFDLTQIPYSSLIALGTVFKEGEIKYGKDNWLSGINKLQYQLERANHALKHLLIHINYLTSRGYKNNITNTPIIKENDLAKVMWFCATQIELERLEGQVNG